jgi:2'-5' RNA ligase
MSVIRAFIAIDLNSDVRQGLGKVMDQLRQQLEVAPVRWVPPENIHLTLKFLGDVSLANLEMLKKIMQSEASSYHPFDLSVGGLGAFPNSRNPRVVWVGVEAPPELGALQRSIEAAMERLGYGREERPFSAHLTLGRVSRNANSHDAHVIGEAIESTKVGFLGMVQVLEVHLFRSDLKPSGAVYSRIFSTPLS